MPRAGKIEQHGLEPVIVECLEQGMNSYEIASKISSTGVKISQPTVARWIKDAREKNRSKADEIFSKHVERELPKDLDALEEMEQMCLAWIREDSATRTERISCWQMVEDALEDLALMIAGANAESDSVERRVLLKGVVKRIMGWVIDDFNDVKQRISAMKMAGGLIEVKLRHSGVLGENEKGKIVMQFPVPQPGVGAGQQPGEQSPRRLFSVKTSGG